MCRIVFITYRITLSSGSPEPEEPHPTVGLFFEPQTGNIVDVQAIAFSKVTPTPSRTQLGECVIQCSQWELLKSVLSLT